MLRLILVVSSTECLRPLTCGIWTEQKEPCFARTSDDLAKRRRSTTTFRCGGLRPPLRKISGGRKAEFYLADSGEFFSSQIIGLRCTPAVSSLALLATRAFRRVILIGAIPSDR